MGRNAEAQEKIIVADIGGDGGEALTQGDEVEAAAALVNLHGIAATHGDMRLGLPFKMAELAANANAASGIALDADGLVVAGPDIVRNEPGIFLGMTSNEELRGFGGFDGGDNSSGGVEHADGVAGVVGAGDGWSLRVSMGGIGRCACSEETCETCGSAGTDGQCDAVAANYRGIDPRNAELYGGVIQKEACLEIVGAIENDVECGKQFFGVAGGEVGDDPFDAHAAVDGSQAALGGNGFGERFEGVGFVEESLALEIRGFDEIAVNDAQNPDSGADKKICKRGTKRSAADKYNA